jgi:hypothetical protein
MTNIPFLYNLQNQRRFSFGKSPCHEKLRSDKQLNFSEPSKTKISKETHFDLQIQYASDSFDKNRGITKFSDVPRPLIGVTGLRGAIVSHTETHGSQNDPATFINRPYFLKNFKYLGIDPIYSKLNGNYQLLKSIHKCFKNRPLIRGRNVRESGCEAGGKERGNRCFLSRRGQIDPARPCYNLRDTLHAFPRRAQSRTGWLAAKANARHTLGYKYASRLAAHPDPRRPHRGDARRARRHATTPRHLINTKRHTWT